MNLEGRVALVTGASQGIGKACAVALAEAGAQVALGSRNLSKLEDVAKELESLGRKALPIQLDVSNHESVAAGISKLLEAWGKIAGEQRGNYQR